jgi:hypothetical protein
VDYNNKYIKPGDCGNAAALWLKMDQQGIYKVQNGHNGPIELYQIYRNMTTGNCLLKADTDKVPGKFMRFYQNDGNNTEEYFAPNGTKITRNLYESLWADIYDVSLVVIQIHFYLAGCRIYFGNSFRLWNEVGDSFRLWNGVGDSFRLWN